jgi:hypothetical protein
MPAHEAAGTDLGVELTRALRAGLDTNRLSVGTSGLSFDLPTGVDPFDFFGTSAGADPAAEAEPEFVRQDIPAMQVAVEDEPTLPQELTAPDMHSVHDLRVALMVQDMAAFGRAVGENEWRNRDRGAATFDYFA